MRHNAEIILHKKRWVLERQVEIFQHYLDLQVDSKLIKSPFREDKNPTCSFYYSKLGRLYLHDFATEEHIDCIQCVKLLFNINYSQAIDKIISDREKFSSELNVSLEKKELNIEFILADNTYYEYFKRYQIPINTLIKYDIYPLKSLYINEVLVSKGSRTNPMFGLMFPSGNIKIYRPLSKDKSKKWGGNCNGKDVAGLKQLPKKGQLLLVTSSLKDVVMLNVLGYNAIAFNGEGYGIGDSTSEVVKQTLDNLSKRFTYIVFYLNNDEAGIKFTNKLQSIHNKKAIFNPIHKPKDISDYVQKYGTFKAIRMLKKQLSKQFKVKSGFLEFISTLS